LQQVNLFHNRGMQVHWHNGLPEHFSIEKNYTEKSARFI